MLWDSMEVVNETEQSKLGVFVLWNGIVLALKGFNCWSCFFNGYIYYFFQQVFAVLISFPYVSCKYLFMRNHLLAKL